MGNQQVDKVYSVFKTIPDFPYYSVNMGGEVLSNRRGIKLSQQVDKLGYSRVHLSVDGEDFNEQVHRLVAKTFIPNPENKRTVNHVDGVKTNNRVENLEWATHSENNIHAIDSGLRISCKGETRWSSTLTDEQVYSICKLLESGKSVKYVSEKFSSKIGIISSINTGEKWKHISNKFKLNPKRLIRLTVNDVHNICNMFEVGFSLDEVCAVFKNSSKATLKNILDKKSHKLITCKFDW